MKKYGITLLFLIISQTSFAHIDHWDFRKLFLFKAETSITEPGWHTLSLPQEWVDTLDPNLSNLRVYEGDGLQSLRAFVENRAECPAEKEKFEAMVVNVRRNEKLSPEGLSTYTETYEIALPESIMKRTDALMAPWKISFKTQKKDFTKTVMFFDSHGDFFNQDSGEEMTIFRISGSKAEKTTLPLSTLPARFSVELKGDHGYLEPEIFLEKESPKNWKLHFLAEESDAKAPRKISILWGGDRFRSAISGWSADVSCRDLSKAPVLEVSARQENPLYQTKSFLEDVLRPGAVVDPSLFSHHVKLHVPKSPDGLTTVSLRVQDWSLLKQGTDVRFVDSQMREWSYWLDPRKSESTYSLVTSTREEERKTIYTLKNPFKSWGKIILKTPDTHFSRPYELRVKSFEKGTYVLDRGVLTGVTELPGKSQVSITVPGVPDAEAQELELEIQNGNNQPLLISEFLSSVTVPRVILAAPEGDYQMLLGSSKIETPQYDLADSAVDLMSIVPAALTPTEEPMAYEKGNDRGNGLDRSRQNWLFLVMGLAVVVLAILTLRVAKK